jgi:hypothetical protein
MTAEEKIAIRTNLEQEMETGRNKYLTDEVKNIIRSNLEKDFIDYDKKELYKILKPYSKKYLKCYLFNILVKKQLDLLNLQKSIPNVLDEKKNQLYDENFKESLSLIYMGINTMNKKTIKNHIVNEEMLANTDAKLKS